MHEYLCYFEGSGVYGITKEKICLHIDPTHLCCFNDATMLVSRCAVSLVIVNHLKEGAFTLGN